jgi:hypothetical protein
MPAVRATEHDCWDDIWDQYEARLPQVAAAEGPGPLATDPPAAAPEEVRPVPRRRRLALVAGLFAALGLAMVAEALQPSLELAGALLRQDAPGLLAQVVMQPSSRALQEELRCQAGLPSTDLPRTDLPRTGMPDAAQRFLGGLAEQVAAGWADPGAVRQVLLARLAPGAEVRDPAMPVLERLRNLRPQGWGGLRLDIGPSEGSGGFGLNLAWRDGAWRATEVALLDEPASPRGGGRWELAVAGGGRAMR